MTALRFTSVQAPNQDFVIQSLSDYAAARLSVPTEAVFDIPWQDRERALFAGEIDVGWVCGLPYVQEADAPQPAIDLLAAPVMRHRRYRDRPIYYSDVIVRKADRYRQFMDLRGARWAFNEPHSHSGYNVTRFHLAQLGAPQGFFKSVVQAGSHQASILMVLDGSADAAAIDSTVLEIEQRSRPEIRAGLRVIDSLGPSPSPPLVIRRGVDPGLRRAILGLLLEIHLDRLAQGVLRRAGIKRFAVVEDRSYDPIRAMARAAQPVQL